VIASILRSILLPGRQIILAEEVEAYASETSRVAVEKYQIEKFNDIWRYCLSEVPFYRGWADRHRLPESVENLAELQSFPKLTKADLVERADEVFQHGRIQLAYSTGGSTGTPTRFPRAVSDTPSFYANTYAGRSWWGIRPFDSYVHVWGHAHLFGAESGLPGRVVKARRAIADRLANAVRLNAYDMSDSAIEGHVQATLKRNPSYIVGYTSAVFRLARHIQAHHEGATSRLTNLRGVIVTAETVTRADADLIGKVFGVPVVTEYGAAETGVIACSRGGTWPLQVLWRSFIVSIGSDSELAVTTLTEREFPLINYAIGDRAEGGDVANGNALTLDAVLGRSQDSVTFSKSDGQLLELSAILPVHLLKSEPHVTAVQLRQETEGHVRVFLSATEPLDLDSVSATFADKLRSDHAGFDRTSVVLEQVDSPLLTKAGKQALFA